MVCVGKNALLFNYNKYDINIIVLLMDGIKLIKREIHIIIPIIKLLILKIIDSLTWKQAIIIVTVIVTSGFNKGILY